MVFKTIESDITRSGQSLSIFGKEIKNIYRDFSSAVDGIKNKTGNISQFSIGRIFGNKLSQQDIQAIKNYNEEIKKYNQMTDDAVSPQTAFYKCLGNSSSTAQQLAREANGAAVSEELLTQNTQTLTFAQKASAAASQVMGVALKMALNLGIGLIISAIISGITKLVNGQKELREKIKQTADEAKQSSTEISNLYNNYLELSQAVENGTGSKEDLTSATDDLLKALGLEGIAVDELTKKYGSLENAISATTIESLKNAHNEIVANVDAYKDDLLKIGDSWDSSHWGNANYLDFSSQDKGEAVSVDEYNEILNIFDKIGNIKKYIDTHDSVNPLTNYYLGGDTKTVEGIVKNYETLVKLQDELVSKFGAERAGQLDIYQRATERASELKTA